MRNVWARVLADRGVAVDTWLMIEHKPPTHETLDMDVQWDLGDALAEAADDEPVTHTMVEAVAEAHGAPVSHVFIGAALDPMMEWEQETDVELWVCAGSCQHSGAGALLERLLALRTEKMQDGKAPFHIIPRGCLSICEKGPVMISRSPHGEVTHPELAVEDLDEVVSLLTQPA